jgi:DNA-binding response OmpR family regulator
MESRRWLAFAVAAQFPAISAANVTIYPESHELFISDRNVRCTRSQLRLLAILLSNFCKTVPFERLLSANGRRISAREQNVLQVNVCNLRRMLQAHGGQLEIKNVYGTGYQAQPLGESFR